MDEEFKIDVLNKQAQALTQLDLAEHPGKQWKKEAIPPPPIVTWD